MSELKPEEVAEIVELAEARAMADSWQAVSSETATQLGMRLGYFGGAVALAMSQMPIMLTNRVIGLGIREPATEAMLDEVVDFYSATEIPWAVALSPASRPPELAQWLEVRGLRRHDSWVKVIRGTELPPAVPTDLRVELAGPGEAQLFADVGLAAFGMPERMRPWVIPLLGRTNWRHYLAYDGDKAVAIGSLYLNGEVGWLGNGATLPSHRNRGAQGAIMARRIEDGIEAGCKWLATETGEETPDKPNPSYHNMLRTGFRPAYARPNYY